MKLSEYIPERIKERTTSGFYDTLDALLSYKEGEIARALRVNNPVLLNDNKWLIRNLADYGFSGIPQELPTAVLQQVLLNAGTLIRTRGSKVGVELFCSVFSLGEVTLDDSEYYTESGLLIPNSSVQGFLTDDSDKTHFFILDDTEDLIDIEPLYINIESPYIRTEYFDVIREFLQNTISSWLGFNPGKIVRFSFINRNTPYYHRLLNNYFV